MLSSIILKNCRINGYIERSLATAVQKASLPSSSSSTDTVKLKNKRGPKSAEEKETDWEKYIFRKLAREFSVDKRSYSKKAQKHEAQCNLVSHIRSDNVRKFFGLASAVTQYVQKSSDNIVSPEFFAIVLKYTSILLEYDYALRTSEEWKSIIYGAINFMHKVPLLDDLTSMGYASALQSMICFIDQYGNEIGLDDMGSDLMRLKNKLDSVAAIKHDISFNQMIFNPADYDNMALMTSKGFDELPKKQPSDSGTYDKDVGLVSDLIVKKVSSNFESPFAINQRTKDDYINMFKDQLKSELGGYLKVKNIARKSQLEPMEAIIDKLCWKESIEKNIKLHEKQIKDPIIKSALLNLDYEGCSEAILDVVKCYLSQGQKLFSVDEFKYSLSNAVLNFCYKSFLDKIQINSDVIVSKVFNSFVEYFTDNTISQRYTLREWWMNCCFLNNVDPEISLPLTEFRSSLRSKISGILTNIVISSCKKSMNNDLSNVLFFQKVPQEEESTTGKKVGLCKMIRIHSEFMKLIEKHEFEYMLFPHEYLPLQIPPRPWIDEGKNGPFYTRPSKILRILPEYNDIDINDEFRNRLQKTSQGRPIFDALNDLGSTPWIINNSMLDVLTKIFHMCSDSTKEELLSTLSVPLHASTIDIPEFTEVFGDVNVSEITTEQWGEYRKKKAIAIKKKNEMNSLWCWLHYRIALACHYRNDVLFFPHNMDFRGRVYPISPHLNHMGDDINRCILKFARGKPLGERGLYWLKLHIVNITGLLKRQSIDERIKYAEEHLDDILDSANNPLDGKKWWLQSEEPWQTLAACIELRDALASGDPESFISHLPIHQDGSCNGLQHYAALGKDLQGALEVNLLPTDVPADVYSSVAARVEEKRIEDENNENSPDHEIAVKFRQFLSQALPRKVIKQTVMTTVYGVTEYGARQQIKKQLKTYANDDTDPLELARFSAYLSKHTFASLHDAFTTSMEIKEWLREASTAICKLGYPTEWVTPLGLPVMQPYLDKKIKMQKVCKVPVRHKQVNAFPPNYVHSLDSTHMMLTTLHCHQRGITFAAVHDCFWTHASSVDEMNEICREQFVRMHNEPLIDTLASFLRRKYLPPSLLKRMNDKDKEMFERTLTPNFKAGDLDINKVKESVYFFS